MARCLMEIKRNLSREDNLRKRLMALNKEEIIELYLQKSFDLKAERMKDV